MVTLRRSSRVRGATTLLVLAALLAASTALAAETRTTTLVGTGEGYAETEGVSDDGSVVFFYAEEDLLPEDDNGIGDIYQQKDGVLSLVTTGPHDGNLVEDARFWQASENGSRAFFSTSRQLVATDTDEAVDIYERHAGVTTLLSTGPTGGNGAFSASFNGASEDSSRVFFTTREQLVAADTDEAVDIYERHAGETTLISTGSSGGNGAFDVFLSSVSADGSRVFFKTQEQLVAADTDSSLDIYERYAGETALVSTGPDDGKHPNFPAEYYGSSSDGTRVIFSTQQRLVPADTDSSRDFYERHAGVTTLISTGPSGGNGAFDVGHFIQVSKDGSRVFFTTKEQLVAADTDSSLDVYERHAGVTTLVSTGPTGGNGAFDVFPVGRASEDGSRIFFMTSEQLVAADTDESIDIYERHAGETTLVSTGASGGNGDFSASLDRVSADGSRVFFTTREQLVAADTDEAIDLYERHAGVTTLISTGPEGGNGDHDVLFGAASDDGRVVAFNTTESLVATDTDEEQDVYLSVATEPVTVVPPAAPSPPAGPGPPAETGSPSAERPVVHRCAGQPATIVGTARGETIRGTPGRDVIVALGGNDRIFGRGGNDLICAGPGNDLVRAGAGNDRVLGGPGNDRIFGGAGNDALFGNGGRDLLAGGPGRDLCRGGAGKDRISQCER